MNILNILKMLFCPKSFAAGEIEHAKKQIAEENAVYDLDKFYVETLERLAKKRRGMLISFLWVFATFLLGYIVALFVNDYWPMNISSIRLVRLTAMIIIAWAVLGRLGYETPTIDGKTLLEKTSEGTFRFLYLIALFIAAVSLFLLPETFNNQIKPTSVSGC